MNRNSEIDGDDIITENQFSYTTRGSVPVTRTVAVRKVGSNQNKGT